MPYSTFCHDFPTHHTGRIVGADIVEYNPDRDVDFLTASVAAKIMKEFAAKIILSNKM
jgi:arginase family enzyme